MFKSEPIMSKEALFLLSILFWVGVCSSENLALNKPVMASTIVSNVKEAAVDGNPSQNWNSGSCVGVGGAQLFMVDLSRIYTALSVSVTNEIDMTSNPVSSLHDFVIEVFLSNPEIFNQTGSLCGTHVGILRDPTDFVCPLEVAGRFVRLRKLDLTTYISYPLCEISVHGNDIVASSPTCSRLTLKTIHEAKLTNVVPASTLIVASRVACVVECYRHVGCQAFNFGGTGSCELITFVDQNGEITPTAGWSVSAIVTFVTD